MIPVITFITTNHRTTIICSRASWANPNFIATFILQALTKFYIKNWIILLKIYRKFEKYTKNKVSCRLHSLTNIWNWLLNSPVMSHGRSHWLWDVPLFTYLPLSEDSLKVEQKMISCSVGTTNSNLTIIDNVFTINETSKIYSLVFSICTKC